MTINTSQVQRTGRHTQDNEGGSRLCQTLELLQLAPLEFQRGHGGLLTDLVLMLADHHDRNIAACSKFHGGVNVRIIIPVLGGAIHDRVIIVEHRGIEALPYSRARFKLNVHILTGALANTVQDRHCFINVVLEAPWAQWVSPCIGQLTDHCDGRRLVCLERQRGVFVLQQHECAFSSVLCCVAMLRCGQGCGSVSLVNVGMFKQAKVELGAQYAADSLIQDLHRDTSVLYRFGQVLVCGLEHRHFHIKTGVDGSRARIGQVLGEMLDGERVDSVRVRHNEPLEAEFVAKRVGQQPLVARGRHAVQIHVRAHDVACASGNSVTEGRQIHVVKF